MTTAEQIALVCDYLRSRDDIAGHINDEIGIAQVGVPVDVQRIKCNRMLDTAEAMNYSAIGEMIVRSLVDAYLQRAIEWRNDRRPSRALAG